MNDVNVNHLTELKKPATHKKKTIITKTIIFFVFILKKKKKMLEKFRGTLYGILVGDCFGALFQEQSILSKGSRLVLRNFLDNLEKKTVNAGIFFTWKLR